MKKIIPAFMTGALAYFAGGCGNDVYNLGNDDISIGTLEVMTHPHDNTTPSVTPTPTAYPCTPTPTPTPTPAPFPYDLVSKVCGQFVKEDGTDLGESTKARKFYMSVKLPTGLELKSEPIYSMRSLGGDWNFTSTQPQIYSQNKDFTEYRAEVNMIEGQTLDENVEGRVSLNIVGQPNGLETVFTDYVNIDK